MRMTQHPSLSRRAVLSGLGAAGALAMLTACNNPTKTALASRVLTSNGRWMMPDEAHHHERTWMCWPSSGAIWGPDLGEVQTSIARIAHAVMEREPLSILTRPSEVVAVTKLLGNGVTIHPAPVDDLWARDTLPLFVTTPSGANPLAASRVRFNGWGKKQTHDGDRKLCALVAELLDIALIDVGLTGEGGGLENDGAGTLMANRSSWVNENRNPGWSETRIEKALLELTGAKRMFWADGVKGQDITDDHIDASARFTSPASLITQIPPIGEVGIWAEATADLCAMVDSRQTLAGARYRVGATTDPVPVVATRHSLPPMSTTLSAMGR